MIKNYRLIAIRRFCSRIACGRLSQHYAEQYAKTMRKSLDWDPMCLGVWLNADGTKVEPTIPYN